MVSVYEAGAVNAGNDNSLKSTVVRGNRLAKQDWFAQRAGR